MIRANDAFKLIVRCQRGMLLACLLLSCSKENTVNIGDPPDGCSQACLAASVCESGLCHDATRSPCGWYAPSDPTHSEMCLVGAGTFPMGCAAGTAGCGPESQPVEQVTLSRGWFIDAFEVTNASFAAFLQSAPSIPEPRCSQGNGPWVTGSRAAPPGLEGHPVVCVTPSQAEAFCAWAGKQLPTESWWEATARGSAGTRFPWGNSFKPEAAQCLHEWTAFDPTTQCADTYPAGTCPDSEPDIACPQTAPVTLQGEAPARASGRAQAGPYDLAGNVSEWVEDGWTPNHSACAQGCVDPEPAPPAGMRVHRGGSWAEPAEGIASWVRTQAPDTAALPTVGFRCARVR